MKTCLSCGLAKPAEDFHRNKARTDGLAHECKVCATARARAYYERNKADVLAKSKVYRNSPAGRAKRRELSTKARVTAPHLAAERNKRWRKKHYATVREAERCRDRAAVDQLKDHYLRRLVVHGTRIAAASVPAVVVQLKRDQMVLRRLSEQLQQAASQTKEPK